MRDHPLRVGIVGSRRRNSVKDWDLVMTLVMDLPPGTQVISGGCPKGADAYAKQAVRKRLAFRGDIPDIIEHLPIMSPKPTSRWDVTKRMYDRNRKIAEDCDVLLALVAKDRKGGTENTIKHARDLRKLVIPL